MICDDLRSYDRWSLLFYYQTSNLQKKRFCHSLSTNYKIKGFISISLKSTDKSKTAYVKYAYNKTKPPKFSVAIKIKSYDKINLFYAIFPMKVYTFFIKRDLFYYDILSPSYIFGHIFLINFIIYKILSLKIYISILIFD